MYSFLTLSTFIQNKTQLHTKRYTHLCVTINPISRTFLGQWKLWTCLKRTPSLSLAHDVCVKWCVLGVETGFGCLDSLTENHCPETSCSPLRFWITQWTMGLILEQSGSRHDSPELLIRLPANSLHHLHMLCPLEAFLLPVIWDGFQSLLKWYQLPYLWFWFYFAFLKTFEKRSACV